MVVNLGDMYEFNFDIRLLSFVVGEISESPKICDIINVLAYGFVLEIVQFNHMSLISVKRYTIKC